MIISAFYSLISVLTSEIEFGEKVFRVFGSKFQRFSKIKPFSVFVYILQIHFFEFSVKISISSAALRARSDNNSII